ncbi:WhiB family transcriptional regulator [Mycolicibacterium sp. CBMA 234]|uniref:WhiB family transcriptional regulator n=1 Tax=Mycolicibacterium sp. CBMA 234 TaxID=1918495 RepID=UPI0012DF900A
MTGSRTTLPLPMPTIRPVADEWEWQSEARCRTMDTNIFFHPDAERGLARRQRVEQAKQICSTCPVIMQCADFASRSQEPFGTWGGISETDRMETLGIRDRRSTTGLAHAARRAAREAKLDYVHS